MSVLSTLDFGNETADDATLEELLSYFVEQPRFDQFVSDTKRLAIATARKGVGKSALVQWAAHTVGQSHPEAVVIKCRGADLAGIGTSLSDQLVTPNDHIRNWMVRICTLVNRHLASGLKVALTDDQMALIEAAEIEGFKSRNLVSALADRLQAFFPKGGTSKLGTADAIALLGRYKQRPQLWILVDDLDATFQNTNKENVELGTFFSACRYLAQDIPDLYFRVTMRTDVWSIVRRFDESLDKLEQYVQEITWPLAEFRRILFRRIKAHVDKSNVGFRARDSYHSEEELHEDYLALVFVPKMPWGDKQTYTYRVIHTLSYERPRWAIQLCKLAQASALQDRLDRIQKENIDEVWAEYGVKRIKDLVAEHKHQCPQIEELLNGFRGAERLMPRDQLFAWINNRISNHLKPTIEGHTTSAPREIAHFLYRIGFIVARSEDGDSYRHYHFHEMPDFLTSRTDDDFSVKWEVHPCYREALDIKKLDKSHRRGFQRRRQQ